MIVPVFILNGLFFALLLPSFQNPDEAVHYSTVQHWAEPKIKDWQIKEEPKKLFDPSNIATLNFSEEITRTAQVVGFDEIRFENKNTQAFISESNSGQDENLFRSESLSRYITARPSATSGTQSWYYLVASWIEKGLSGSDIFTRMFAVRAFSVMLGALTVVLAYFTFRKAKFSDLESLLLASLIAFQPMFTATAAQINIDIALILSFALFTFTGAWILREEISWRTGILLAFSTTLGFFAKGPGIVLIALTPLLLGYTLWTRFGADIKDKTSSLGMPPRSLWLSAFLALLLIGATLSTVIPPAYISSITNASATSQFDSAFASLAAYIDKTIDIDAFRSSALSYWGNFGWLDTSIHDSVFNLIWTVEIIALTGLLLYLIPWRPKRFPTCLSGSRDFLPAKHFIIALLLLSLALELAIRFYDWRVFDAHAKILIGTPGRYFLPNIVAHIALLVTGLGFFCRSRIQFHWLLKSLFVLMLLLQLYSMFGIILPRYYL